MRFRREIIDQTIAFSASQPGSVTINPRNGQYILGLGLNFQLPKTEASPVYNQDGIFRVATGLQLGGGSSPYLAISAPDLRPLYWHHRVRTGMIDPVQNYVAGAITQEYTLPIIFGVNPVKSDGHLNFEDPSVGVPRETGLTLVLNWGAATAMGSGITIGSGLCQVELFLCQLDPGDQPPPMRPNWATTRPTVTQGLGLQMTDALANNAVYRRSLIMINQGVSPADVRSDGFPNTAVSEVGVVQGAGTVLRRMKTWVASRLAQAPSQAADDNGAVPGATLVPGVATTVDRHNPGVVGIDWYDLLPTGAKSPYGIDMRDTANNDLRLAYSVDVATNTAITELHERLMPQGT